MKVSKFVSVVLCSLQFLGLMISNGFFANDEIVDGSTTTFIIFRLQAKPLTSPIKKLGSRLKEFIPTPGFHCHLDFSPRISFIRIPNIVNVSLSGTTLQQHGLSSTIVRTSKLEDIRLFLC